MDFSDEEKDGQENSKVEISIGETDTDTKRIFTARKDYVSAYADKSVDSVSLDTSELGYEGIFKTVLVTSLNTNNQINVEGGTAEGGEPIVSGFPLRDATSDHCYAKNPYYCGSIDGGPNSFVWISYDLITDWAYLELSSNYSKTYPKASYGQLIYVRNLEHW